MNKWQPDYDWSHFLPNTNCMCEQCFNAYDRMGKIKHVTLMNTSNKIRTEHYYMKNFLKMMNYARYGTLSRSL